MSTLFFSLGVGAVTAIIPRKFLAVLITLSIAFYVSNFRSDIWRNIGDSEQFSGKLWDEQRSSALQDFWPRYGDKLPDNFAFTKPKVEGSRMIFPTVYFPGWQVLINNQSVKIYPEKELGLISIYRPQVNDKIELRFTDTPPRVIGNLVSLITLIGLGVWRLKYVAT